MNKFIVSPNGRTLSAEGVVLPINIGSALGLTPADLKSSIRLGDFAEDHPPLRQFLEDRYADYHAALQSEAAALKNEKEPSSRTRLKELKARLKKLPSDPVEGLLLWLDQLDGDEFTLALKPKVEAWASGQVSNLSDEDYENYVPNVQRLAIDFFRDQDPATLELLGVSIVEGDCPGSTYFAAELNNTVEDANRIAIEHKIPIRFIK